MPRNFFFELAQVGKSLHYAVDVAGVAQVRQAEPSLEHIFRVHDFIFVFFSDFRHLRIFWLGPRCLRSWGKHKLFLFEVNFDLFVLGI